MPSCVLPTRHGRLTHRPQQLLSPSAASSPSSPHRTAHHDTPRHHPDQDFDLSTEVATLRSGKPGVGLCTALSAPCATATCSRRGARQPHRHVDGLEHYRHDRTGHRGHGRWGHRRFDIVGARVIHRVGLLQPHGSDRAGGRGLGPPGETSRPAWFIMDYLKMNCTVLEKERRPRRRTLGRCPRQQLPCGGGHGACRGRACAETSALVRILVQQPRLFHCSATQPLPITQHAVDTLVAGRITMVSQWHILAASLGHKARAQQCAEKSPQCQPGRSAP